jgi:hypothetical protein
MSMLTIVGGLWASCAFVCLIAGYRAPVIDEME